MKPVRERPAGVVRRVWSTATRAVALSALLAAGCGSSSGSEIGADACANARDDDGDDLIDCADPSCRLFPWCAPDGGPRDAGMPVDSGVIADAFGDPDATLCTATDLVLVVDVSSSMGAALQKLRDSADAIFREAGVAGARIAAVIFVDDALLTNEGVAYTSAEALRGAIDGWIATASSNLSPVSGRPNYDCQENTLDAMALAMTGFAFRGDARRALLVLTDDTFAERPDVLSGPYGPGIAVASTYDELGSAAEARGVRISSITRTGVGQSCGAGRSPDVGRGFTTAYGGRAALPERTGGASYDFDRFVSGELDVGAMIGLAVCGP